MRAAATNGITVGAWGCRRHAMKLCYKALSGTENPFVLCVQLQSSRNQSLNSKAVSGLSRMKYEN